MASGPAISGAGHGVLLVSLFVGGLFQPAQPEVFDTADVALISAEDFAALTSALPQSVPDPEPETVTDVPLPEAPEPDAPSTVPEPEEPLETAEPPPAEVPEAPDPAPEVPDAPVPDPEVTEDTQILTQPDTPTLDTPVPAPLSETPAPLDAPRVAPTPVPETPPAPEIAETPTPRVVPEEDSAAVAEETPQAAPEEATTEIVTEAETPGSGAPATSLRPVARPGTTKVSAPAPEPEPDPEPDPAPEPEATETASPDTDTDAINNAVNDALTGALETPAAPLGPPLSSAEKDGLRVAVQQCWNTGALSTEALNVTVVVAVAMGRDGKPDTGSIRLIGSTGGSDTAASQAFGAARRAIIRCGLNGYNLPVEKYEQWREIEMTFNPERMRIK